MKILVICHYGLYQRPESSFVHAQTREYARLGHDVQVVCPVAWGKCAWNQGRISAKRFELDGVKVLPMRYVSLSSYGRNGFNAAMSRRAARFLLPKLREWQPDIIHAHTLGLDSEVGGYLKAKLGCPLVVTTHGSDTSIPFEQGRIQELKATCDKADQLVAVSSALAEKLRSSGTKTPVISILNGYRSAFLQTKLEKDEYSLLQVGHLQRQKRVHITLQALAEARKAYPAMHMTIIGQGPERSALETLCRELQIADAVSFLGEIPNKEVMTQMAQHRFFVMPSVREGFGIVYLEAMASGCITIGTAGEGIADFIKDGINGFLVAPDRPNLIAQRICWCLEHPEETERIARQGLEDAANQTWEKNAREYIGLFEKWKGKYDHDRKTKADLGE